jgi:hypothetical protein
MHVLLSFFQQFYGFAHELVLATEASATSKFSVVKSLGIAITSHALEQNLTFPFVTLPHYELLTRESRLLSGAKIIAYAPLVAKTVEGGNQTLKWQEYAQEHSGWIPESLQVAGLHDVVSNTRPFRREVV